MKNFKNAVWQQLIETTLTSINDLNVKFDQRGNIFTQENYMTSVEKIFSAGDMRRGQSLVVWAISEGRRCADLMDKYLMSESKLPAI